MNVYILFDEGCRESTTCLSVVESAVMGSVTIRSVETRPGTSSGIRVQAGLTPTFTRRWYFERFRRDPGRPGPAGYQR
jgi:hypothetical protein